MKQLRILLLSAVLLSMPRQALSQIFTTVIDETALQFRVKQVDEFFQRFNYEVTYTGEQPSDGRNSETGRKNLMTLFNMDKFMDEKHKPNTMMQEFMEYVLAKDVKLHYEDTTWCAEVKTSIICEGKKYNATLTLKTERVKDVIFQWVITDVSSPLFTCFPTKPKGHLSISPASHGTGFISLPESVNLNKTAVATALPQGYKRSVLSAFDYLFASGKAKLGPVTNVVYRFNIGKYAFIVEHIEKAKGYNQGWLINSIKKLEKKEGNK